MAEKRYCGKGWKHSSYDLINIQLNRDIISNLPVDKYGNVKIVVALMKSRDEKTKATHTVYVDDFVAQPKQQQQQQNVQSQIQTKDDLPF